MNSPELKRMKVKDLKGVLKDRGVPSSNKLKEELLELSKKAVKVYQPLEPCDHDKSERTRRKVSTSNGQEVNLYGRKVNWSTDLKNLQDLRKGIKTPVNSLSLQCKDRAVDPLPPLSLQPNLPPI